MHYILFLLDLLLYRYFRRLLLILPPSTCKNSECIQYLAGILPHSPLLCAISFSWCIDIWSVPPVCISNSSPKYFLLIVLHSKCHPGYDGPKKAIPLHYMFFRCFYPYCKICFIFLVYILFYSCTFFLLLNIYIW